MIIKSRMGIFLLIICIFMTGCNNKKSDVTNEMEAAIENNELTGFLFSPGEKVICLYEGEKEFEINAHVFAIYKETVQKDIIFENMLYIECGTGDLYTWEGEEFVSMGMFCDEELTLSDFMIQEEETDLDVERNDIIDETLDEVMDILIQAGDKNIKVIYDGMRRFAGREYLVVSSFEENDVKIHRITSYYIDRNNGNIYREENNNDFLRTELYYIGHSEIFSHSDIDNISTPPKKLMESSTFLNDYEEIDYEDLQGEEYYFYLFADCFLKELSSFLEEESSDMSELEKSISIEPDRKENIFQYISDIKEKKYIISKYVFLRTKDDSTSFNDFMEVVVLAEFCIDGQTIEKKYLLLSVQKYYGEEDVTWKLEGIENMQ